MSIAKPLSHPRCAALVAVALLLFSARAITRRDRGWRLERGLAALLTLIILSSAAISLHACALNREFAKDDVRALAAWLETEAAGDNLIVAAWRAWLLDCAYDGAAPVVRPNPAEGDTTWDELTDETAGGRVLPVGYSRAS
jgi:hypothetical protein